jgi:hypothetical protein
MRIHADPDPDTDTDPDPKPWSAVIRGTKRKICWYNFCAVKEIGYSIGISLMIYT